MKQFQRFRLLTTRGSLAALAAAALSTPQSFAQTTLKGGASQTEYTDQYSQNCEQQNANNPFAGMNPLTCHGESAPTDSLGGCSLNIGSVWKKVGNTCYYCSPINPPIQGIIIPLDEVGAAEQQGYRCGADQADACMAVCSGGTGFVQPSGTPQTGGAQGGPPRASNSQPGPGPGPPPGYVPMPGPAGGVGYKPGPNPCLPQGPGGYDYCQNGPGARLPAGCVCSSSTPDPDRLKNPESPGALPLPPGVREALESGAAQMDKMLDDNEEYALAGTNRFFKCLSEEIDADMKFLGQPSHVPAAQVMSALHFAAWQYMQTPPYTNNLRMFQAAQQELNSFKQDPACAMAKIVPAAVAVAVTHVAGAAAEATAVQKAGNEAILLARTEQEAVAGVGKEAGSGLQGKSIGATPGLVLVTEAELNAACGENLCVAQAIAKDVSAATGEPLAGVAPYQGNAALQILEAGGTVSPPISFNTLQPLLESLYRNVKLKGPALSQKMIENQARGIPTQMSSAQAITDSMKGIPGARGIVIVNYKPTALVPKPISHAFNAIVDDAGIPQFIDTGNPAVTGAALFDQVSEVFLYRTQ